MGTFQEWDNLCGKYESAQDDCTTAYLAISARLFTGGTDGLGPTPTAAELARWDVARERLRNIEERMRSFVVRLRERPSEGISADSRVMTDADFDLH